MTRHQEFPLPTASDNLVLDRHSFCLYFFFVLFCGIFVLVHDTTIGCHLCILLVLWHLWPHLIGMVPIFVPSENLV